jgi:hypothetical protein
VNWHKLKTRGDFVHRVQIQDDEVNGYDSSEGQGDTRSISRVHVPLLTLTATTPPRAREIALQFK